ncbi:MAG: polysaccharide pyruvyl transferase family protein [Eubacteriales bacterium]|nr:polysaccharide pyruvyl transferase family protein [Eubacteriales bacterium]
MKKILIRSAMPLGEKKSVSEILLRNLTGSNTGNLIFQHSVARVVMEEDTVITAIKTNLIYSEEQVDRWNEEYDMFLIPLANAFRTSFQKELVCITDLVNRLKIPCVVVGVGLQSLLDKEGWEFPFDEDVRVFVEAVLKKSSMIGLRGEITAEYLRRLGYSAEKDYTVIGCPSLYTFGDSLPTPRLTDLTVNSKVAVNYKMELPAKLYRFLRGQEALFTDSVFISQVVPEIKMIYAGFPYFNEKNLEVEVEDYPMHFSDSLMQNDRVVGVVEDISWMEYLRQRDFSFGSRIHGNIVSILAGTPCYIFAGDCRVKELAQYHNIPYMEWQDVREDTNVIDLYQKTDYSQLKRGHRERVSHYLDFLDKNNVPRIEREALSKSSTPFDRWYQSQEGAGVIHPFPSVSAGEQERRLEEYYGEMRVKSWERAQEIRGILKQERQKKRAILKEKKRLEREKQDLIEKQEELQAELEEIKNSRFYKMKVRYDSLKKK